MTVSTRFIVAISTLAGMAAGYRIVTRRRAEETPHGIPEAQLTEEERERAAAVFQALQDNASEAPTAG